MAIFLQYLVISRYFCKLFPTYKSRLSPLSDLRHLNRVKKRCTLVIPFLEMTIKCNINSYMLTFSSPLPTSLASAASSWIKKPDLGAAGDSVCMTSS